MKRCAFLTTEDLTGYVTDDHLAVGPLRALGWEVEHVPWRAAVDWDRFAVVVVRSPWDYQDDPDAFEAALARIDRSGAALHNPLPLMRWNLRKSYLRELEPRGVAIPPTAWGRAPTRSALVGLFDTFSSDEIVIKPVVGANAGHAYRVRADASAADLERVVTAFATRDFLAQPFLVPVLAEGEFSLIYFGSALSHAILKTPKRGDFRVQEEHGGAITAVQPSTALVAHAQRALAAVAAANGQPTDGPPLYARVDLVRTAVGADTFALMELELIEPALYLRMDAGAAARFAAAVAAS